MGPWHDDANDMGGAWARARNMGFDSWGKSILYGGNKMTFLGMNQVPMGVPDDPIRPLWIVFRCASDWKGLGTPKSNILIFTVLLRRQGAKQMDTPMRCCFGKCVTIPSLARM